MSLELPDGYRFSKEHEWVTPAGDATRVGITGVAADALGEIVYLDLPDVGSTVTAGESCGEIESTKSVAELFSPVTGTVLAVNQDAIDAPETVNAAPYAAGWLFDVEVESEGELLDAAAYAAFAEE